MDVKKPNDRTGDGHKADTLTSQFDKFVTDTRDLLRYADSLLLPSVSQNERNEQRAQIANIVELYKRPSTNEETKVDSVAGRFLKLQQTYANIFELVEEVLGPDKSQLDRDHLRGILADLLND